MIWKVSIGIESVSAEYQGAEGDERGLFVMSHGAGGNMNDRSTLAAANALRKAGLGVVRFNFLYKERGSGRPDPMPKLMDTAAAVAESVQAKLKPDTLIVGGRSMGGRAFSMLAAEGFDADALLLLAYPLHPPGEKGKLRDAHLPSIRMPVLCFNGTRDDFCDPAIMRRVITGVKAPWTMHWLEGADHSFHVLKSSGRTDAQVLVEVSETTRAWLKTLAH
jgi:predicted alpha/beta-hydrolase family hydrolase